MNKGQNGTAIVPGSAAADRAAEDALRQTIGTFVTARGTGDKKNGLLLIAPPSGEAGSLEKQTGCPHFLRQSTFIFWDAIVETDVCEKVDISRILIQRVQGSSKARVSSIEAANRVLDSWAGRSSDESDDRCDFQIVFEDGFRYQGHYHLSKTDKRASLARYVRKQLTALARRTEAAKSSRTCKHEESPAITMTGGDIAETGGDLAESARLALDHYNI